MIQLIEKPTVIRFPDFLSHKRKPAIHLAAALLFATLLPAAIADTITATVNQTGGVSCTGGPGLEYGMAVWSAGDAVGSGTATASLDCTGQYALPTTTTVTASAGINSLGASITANGPSTASAGTGYDQYITFSPTGACSAGGGVECYAQGMALEATFYFDVDGSETGTDSNAAPVFSEIVLAGDTILQSNNTELLESSPSFILTAGDPYFLQVGFELNVNCYPSACSANFADPDVTDVVITDPTTGLPVLGLTTIGDDGTVYATNVGIAGGAASAPEPSSLAFLAIFLLGLGTVSHRRLQAGRRFLTKEFHQ